MRVLRQQARLAAVLGRARQARLLQHRQHLGVDQPAGRQGAEGRGRADAWAGGRACSMASGRGWSVWRGGLARSTHTDIPLLTAPCSPAQPPLT